MRGWKTPPIVFSMVRVVKPEPAEGIAEPSARDDRMRGWKTPPIVFSMVRVVKPEPAEGIAEPSARNDNFVFCPYRA